jgi:methionyl-tRNA formyltransferase
MRIVFMGSPLLAVPSLRALVEAGHEVRLVVTQVARPAGRGRRELQPPVAMAAAELGIAITQPERVRAPESLERIGREAPDAIVVAAYGQILPPALLAIPRLGCINVHPSLLPRHRGTSPISAAILAGDPVTGVSIMLMEAGMDTGPVLSQTTTAIADTDDQVTLTARLAELGAGLLVETLARWAIGDVKPQPQDAAVATVTRRTTPADGLLNWNEPAIALWRRVRAYAEWPQAFTAWEGKRLRILAADHDSALSAEPGRVLAVGARVRSPAAAAIGTREGVLLPRIVGLEGRKALSVDTFLRGYPRLIGARLGSANDPAA